MKDNSLNSGGKAIKVTPDELIFDQVSPNLPQVQQLTLKNNLSAPVEITLKASNADRIEIEPKMKKLAPFESFTCDIIVKLQKAPNSTSQQRQSGAQKFKETIFIKSDFFDQKVNVTLIPGTQSNTTPRDSSLQSTNRGGSRNFQSSNIFGGNSAKHQQETSLKRDHSPFDMEKELEIKQQIISDLNVQLQNQKQETSNAYSMLKEEQLRRRELEEKLDNGTSVDNKSSQNDDILNQIKVLLREREPNLEQLMEISLKKEREHNERKDQKVLEILKVKDRQIEELQQRCVSQESEYGKLAQMFQEQKRLIRQLEEREELLKSNQVSFEQQLEQSRLRIQSFERGKEYQRMLDMEDRVRDLESMNLRLQAELEGMNLKLEEKSTIEAYCEEALERYKDQLQEKDQAFMELRKEFERERELRIREEEHSKSLIQQITQMHQETMGDKAAQKMHADLVNRYNKLQDEKSDQMNHIEELRAQKSETEDRLRDLYDRLGQLRGSNAYGMTMTSFNGKNLVDKVESKVEDIARLIKELEDDNIELTQKNKTLSHNLAQRETELQQVIEENEDMQSQLRKKQGQRSISKAIQTAIEQEDMLVFDEVRDKCVELEDLNDRLAKQVRDMERQIGAMRGELESKDQEIHLISRINGKAHHGNRALRGSVTTTSDVSQSIIMPSGSGNAICQDNSEEVISRLNAKVTQMKMNEDRLQEEIHMLRQQVQSVDQSSFRAYSQNQMTSQHMQSKQSNTGQSIVGLEERIGEYEIILLEQREQLVKLEEENSNLRHQIKEIETKAKNQADQNNLRIKNLQEINSKLEKLSSNPMQSMQQSTDFFMSQNSSKSTAADTERMRQFAQQLELNNMSLKHQYEELKTTNTQQSQELALLRNELKSSEQQLIRLKQQASLQRVGLADGGQESSDSRMAQKLIEQRNKIKYLQGLLIRAKQDFDMLKNNGQGSQIFGSSKEGGFQSSRIDELIKTNERLRREHQQALMVVVDLKEEYSSKLMILNDKNEQARSKIIKENNTLARKLDQMTTQINYMEKKEMRLFGQLEEAKLLQQQESQEKEARTKELEELLFKKEETINELEREIKLKEKTLQERQEQISVLISTLENEHSQDQMKQKLLNLSAELCSVKAIESQQVRKINELTHQIKKIELNSVKSQKLADQEKLRNKDLQKNLKKIENENSSLEKKIQELIISLDDKDRELSEFKFRVEREEFQTTLKEETISQTRDQLRRSEALFKEEIERIRKDFFEQVSKDFEHKVMSDLSKATHFKTAIQSLHLVISDYINNKSNSDDRTMIMEFEKALTIASQTIEKLQQELDKSNYHIVRFNSDLKATALSKVLLSRQEQLLVQLQKMQHHYNNREEERYNYIQSQEQLFKKIINDQDSRIVFLEKENQELEQECSELRDDLRTLKDQKDDLEQSLVLFEQEIENKKQAMERRAELTVDERFKSKHEIIKSYYDSNITRILLNTQSTNNERIVELGREILALKLLVSKLENQIMVEQSETQSLELNLSHYKEQCSSLEQKMRETQLKNNQLIGKLHSQELTVKVEMERKNQEVINIEKEMIRQKDIVETKTRELMILQEKVTKLEQNSKGLQNGSSTQQLEDQIQLKDSQLSQSSEVIKQLQDQLLDIRHQHIAELDDLRTQYDLELSETKRHLQKEREQLEKRYKPGYAPGDIMEENAELVRRVTDLKHAIERVMQENVILRKKLENEKVNNESQRSEIHSYKQAMLELESTMVEMNSQMQNQQQMNQMSQIKDRSQIKVKYEDKKQDKKTGKRKQSLHFNKEAYPEESHSRINHQDSNSLNVSQITQVNMIPTNARPSTSLAYASIQSSNLPKQFIINPPLLVKALVQSKIGELQLRNRVEDIQQNEIQLRQELKQMKANGGFKQGRSNNRDDGQNEIDDYRQRMIELEIENEDLKIQRAQDQIELCKVGNLVNSEKMEKIEYPIQDYSTMIEAVMALTTHIANLENNKESSEASMTIEEAQRLVIKSLTSKIMAERGQIDQISYVPSEEQDRKMWYLELLEQQINTSEQVVSQLQSFIKKLQIDIQGNLQSAAQIKAASMDLANNTKKTAEEVKSLRNIVGLIKHDLNKNIMQPQLQQKQQQEPLQIPQQTLASKTINPFAETQLKQQFDNLLFTNDSLHNQLTVTEKVKKTLEQEIVNLKLHHAQELQSLNSQLSSALDQRNSLLQSNEELHDKVQHLQSNLDKLKAEIQNLSQDYQQNQSILIEKEREKQVLAQNKTTTSKHLQKLQQDMHEWRRQTDDNMKLKEKQITELTSQLASLTTERDRLKSENQMLRRTEKDRKSSESTDLKRLETEKQHLMERLEKEIHERKKEIEFWVTERATMRQMIEQLENEKVEQQYQQQKHIVQPLSSGGGAAEIVDDQIRSVKKKSMRKIKQKEIEIKNKEKQVQELQDQLHKVKQQATQLEQKLRELKSSSSEAEERSKFYQSKIKELELERDLVLAERNNAISSQDLSAQHIQIELNSLRECFAKLKIERDNLLADIDSTSVREREWRTTVDQLNEELSQLQDQLDRKDREQSESIRVLESKNHTLLQDLKYLKTENERLKGKVRESDDHQLKYEQKIHEYELKIQESDFKLEELRRFNEELKAECRSTTLRSEDKVKEIQNHMLILESGKMRDIDLLQKKLDEVRDSNAQLMSLYEGQLAELRSRFQNDKKKTEQQVDQMFSLAQRESVVKSLKKELSTVKSSLAKVKAKNKELKLLAQNQENQSSGNGTQKNIKKLNSKHSFVYSQPANILDEIQDKSVVKLAQMMLSDQDGGYSQLLEQMQKTNSMLGKYVEMQAEVEKYQNLQRVLTQQVTDLDAQNSDLRSQIDTLSKLSLKESKLSKQSQINSEISKQQRQELKQLQQEIDQMKQEWVSPSDARQSQERIRDYLSQIKTLKEEVQRKKDVINQIKSQKEQQESEAKDLIADLEGLKDDNAKLQKVMKENSKNMAIAKDYKIQNDYLKQQEKRYKEDLAQLNERIKQAKIEIQRKDQIIKDYKDKLDFIQDEVNQSKDRMNEIERLKELIRKLKVETEIKDNQVKAIKVKLDHTENELDSYKQQSISQVQTSQINQQNLESQMKISKNKIKKYELYLKKSLEALRRIGKELSHYSSKVVKRGSQNSSVDNPMKISEFERDMYKDSVNILGMSMDELEDFMNPNSTGATKSKDNQFFMAQLDKVVEIPESLNQDLEQICNYCMKLISDMNPDVKFV